MNYICATEDGQESADKIDFCGLQFADCGGDYMQIYEFYVEFAGFTGGLLCVKII